MFLGMPVQGWLFFLEGGQTFCIARASRYRYFFVLDVSQIARFFIHLVVKDELLLGLLIWR